MRGAANPFPLACDRLPRIGIPRIVNKAYPTCEILCKAFKALSKTIFNAYQKSLFRKSRPNPPLLMRRAML